MINDEILNYDMSHLTQQQIDHLHAIKNMVTVRLGKLALQRMKSDELAKYLRTLE